MTPPRPVREEWYPHFRITIPDGKAYLTRVEMDGQELRGITTLKVEAGVSRKPRQAELTLTFYADIEVEGELPIVKEWRYLRPPFHRLRLLLRRLVG